MPKSAQIFPLCRFPQAIELATFPRGECEVQAVIEDQPARSWSDHLRSMLGDAEWALEDGDGCVIAVFFPFAHEPSREYGVEFSPFQVN